MKINMMTGCSVLKRVRPEAVILLGLFLGLLTTTVAEAQRMTRGPTMSRARAAVGVANRPKQTRMPLGSARQIANGITGSAYDPDTPGSSVTIAVSIGGPMGSRGSFGESIRTTRPRYRTRYQPFEYLITEDRARTISNALGGSGTYHVYVYAMNTEAGLDRLLTRRPLRLEIIDPDSWRSPTYSGPLPKVMCKISRLGIAQCLNVRRWLAMAELGDLLDLTTGVLDTIYNEHDLDHNHDTILDCGGSWTSVATDPTDTLLSDNFMAGLDEEGAAEARSEIGEALGNDGESAAFALPGGGFIPEFADACQAGMANPNSNTGPTPGSSNPGGDGDGSGNAIDNFQAYLDAVCAADDAGGQELVANGVAQLIRWIIKQVVKEGIEEGVENTMGDDDDDDDRFRRTQIDGAYVNTANSTYSDAFESDGELFDNVNTFSAALTLSDGSSMTFHYYTFDLLNPDGTRKGSGVRVACRVGDRECTPEEQAAALEALCKLPADQRPTLCPTPPPAPPINTPDPGGAGGSGGSGGSGGAGGSGGSGGSGGAGGSGGSGGGDPLGGDCQGDEAGCGSVCDELRGWWTIFSMTCESSNWEAYECRLWVNQMNGCNEGDPALVYPNPVDDSFVCGSVDDAEIERQACEFLGGFMDCIDEACDCILEQNPSNANYEARMGDPCNSPYAYCPETDEMTPVPGGLPDIPGGDTPPGDDDGGGGFGGSPGF